MFIVFNEQKRRTQPDFFHGLPIAGFLTRKGRLVSFHKGWYLQPVILESDYISAIASAIPAPRRPSAPYKAPPQAKKPRRGARRGLPAAPKARRGWTTTHETLRKYHEEYKNLALGDRASRFQGYIYHSKSKLNLIICDRPQLPKKSCKVSGFNMYILVRVKKTSPTRKHTDDYLVCGAVVRWGGTINEILEKIYSDTLGKQKVPQGDSIQNTVPWRTAIDALAMMFFDTIGEPIKLLGIQFRREFNRSELSRIRHLQKERDERVSAHNRPKWRKRYRKNPKEKRQW